MFPRVRQRRSLIQKLFKCKYVVLSVTLNQPNSYLTTTPTHQGTRKQMATKDTDLSIKTKTRL